MSCDINKNGKKQQKKTNVDIITIKKNWNVPSTFCRVIYITVEIFHKHQIASVLRNIVSVT